MRQLLVVMIGLMFSVNSFSQCAMCRATAESATEHVDQGIGEALNSGIVYLMLLPYILLFTVAIVFFRKKIFAFFKPETA